MIYLIGGPPRVGKSQLMNKFIAQRPMPAFSCDFLYDLEQVKQIQGFGGANILEKGQLFFPTLEQLLINVSFRAEDCIIEGEVILPEMIPEFAKLYDIRACFIGMPRTSLENIINFGGFFNWPQYKLDNGMSGEVQDLAERTKLRSIQIMEEAKKYNQQYFDFSLDYEKSAEMALHYLLGLPSSDN